MELKNRLCQVCQSTFIASREWSKYCSFKCQRKAASLRYRKENKEKLASYHANKYRQDKKSYLEAARKCYLRNRERYLMEAKQDRREMRVKIILKYGGKCSCCGEMRHEFLAIDHVYGGGRKDREKKGTQKYYRLLLTEEKSSKYRVLCHNCNSSLGYYGYCPHNKEFK